MNELILVVDDSSYNTELLTEILEDQNFKVISVTSDLPVLEMAQELKPAVILLDIMTPSIDGFEVCKSLKNHYEVSDIPIIMVTAEVTDYDIKKSLEYGAFDYIKKPIENIEVIARVQSALRLKTYKDQIKKLAMKDGLTGLYNHSLLIELFEKKLSNKQRNSQSIAFVMLDIDHFKSINDTYGHVSGNIVLKELANILKTSVRNGDIVGRYGGDEFNIVLTEIDKPNAFKLCNRIRENIESFDFDIGSRTIKITVSMGIAFTDPDNNLSGTQIIQKADEELYLAKNNGRNRIEICVS